MSISCSAMQKKQLLLIRIMAIAIKSPISPSSCPCTADQSSSVFPAAVAEFAAAQDAAAVAKSLQEVQKDSVVEAAEA